MNAAGPFAAAPVAPIYGRRRFDPPQPWRARGDWAVSQRVDDPDPARANSLALLDLEGGADALTLVTRAGWGARGHGLSDGRDLAAALEGVELDLIGVRLDAGAQTLAVAEAMVALAEQRRLGSARLAVDFGFDPIALQAFGGAADAGTALALVRLFERAGFAGKPLLCDGRVWHEAGAVEARELALVLASAVALFRRLETAGTTLAAARGAVAVLLPFDADVLLGMAKARAMRRLWARLEAACGLEPAALMLHAESSWRMMTRFDPHTNAMRVTAAVHAAGLGGADSVTALPMTLAAALPDADARRLARNIGRVLLDEADGGAVIDPAAGSGAFESLTDDLCNRAWALFQAIERDGGIEAALLSGAVQNDLAADAQRRRQEIERFERGIVGTSRFPQLGGEHAAVDSEKGSAVTAGETSLPATTRDAIPFEHLRDQAGRAGVRPTVFLATLGAPADFGARVSQAANLFAAVGIDAVPPPLVSRDVTALAAAFADSGARAACLCGHDAAYEAEGAAAAALLAEAGALVLALGAEVEGATTLMPSGGATLPVLRRTLAALLGPHEPS